MGTVATVIGRGHGGTRAAAAWLEAAGFDIGPTNESKDRQPFDPIYRAGEIALAHVPKIGAEAWDFGHLNTCPIPDEWTEIWSGYLEALGDGAVAWKLPETVFSWPWLARTHPEIRYLIWHRDPRSSILGKHITDDLGRWGLEGWPSIPWMRERALSWVCQYSLIECVPKPPHTHTMRLQDFVRHQEREAAAVSKLLGLAVPMPPMPIKPRAIQRHADHTAALEPAMDLIRPFLHNF